MPNIAAALRQEITRLARRESRGQMQALRKASARFRKDIARLKREAAAMSSELSRLRRHARQAPAAASRPADSAKVRFRARWLISHRKRLGISAADYGKLVGVAGKTVYQWEHGAARPRRAQLVAIASIRALGK